MFARDVMTPEAEWIAPDLSLAEVGRIMRDKCIGCLPVGEEDERFVIVDPADGRPDADELVMVMNGFDTNFDEENELYGVNTIAYAYDEVGNVAAFQAASPVRPSAKGSN